MEPDEIGRHRRSRYHAVKLFPFIGVFAVKSGDENEHLTIDANNSDFVDNYSYFTGQTFFINSATR